MFIILAFQFFFWTSDICFFLLVVDFAYDSFVCNSLLFDLTIYDQNI